MPMTRQECLARFRQMVETGLIDDAFFADPAAIALGLKRGDVINDRHTISEYDTLRQQVAEINWDVVRKAGEEARAMLPSLIATHAELARQIKRAEDAIKAHDRMAARRDGLIENMKKLRDAKPHLFDVSEFSTE